MSTSLNVIALISGGKDSFFSLQHCLANGHTIIALANLYPAPTPNDEDPNSYMYQTVGHSVIPLYASALGIPLYRQQITGKAVNSSRDYSAPSAPQDHDETEDLVPLLARIKAAHPTANALSSGAILSTYQRTRVESVALRLGLTPLAFLWQYPLLPPYSQTALLHDMGAAGLDALIIKTASGGLDERFLGANVSEARTVQRLMTAMARFGEGGNGAVVGEGGEFETLAVKGPRPLWKGRVVVKSGEARVLDGGQAVLGVEGGEVVELGEGEGDAGELRIPELFDDEFRRVLDAAGKSTEESSSVDQTLGQLSIADSHIDSLPRNTTTSTPAILALSNLSADPSTPSTPSEQLSRILASLTTTLSQHALAPTAINHATLLLRNMSDFTLLNPIYGSFFTSINPPARVTIAAGSKMPTGIDVMLSVILDRPIADTSIDRQALHVQGRSYWAPANIGPYSQAVSVVLPACSRGTSTSSSHPACRSVYIAGQIPLVPATMELHTTAGFPGQIALSLQHLWRVGRAMDVAWWTAGVAYIPACADDEVPAKLRQVADMWRDVHCPRRPNGTSDDDDDDGEGSEDDDDDVDPWDRLNTHATAFTDTTFRAPIPRYDSVTTADGAKKPVPPCFVAQVEELPRGAGVEWSALGVVAGEIGFSTSPLRSAGGQEEGGGGAVSTTTLSGSTARFVAIEMRCVSDVEAARRVVGRWGFATVYVGRGFEVGDREWEGVQWVFCRRVWGAGGRECVGVVVGRVDGGSEVGVLREE